MWEYPQGNGKQFEFNGKDSFGAIAHYSLTNWSPLVTSNNIGFIIKGKDSWDEKDGINDRHIDFKDLIKDKHGVYHIYIVSGKEDLFANEKCDVINPFKYAKFFSFNEGMFESNLPVKSFKVLRNNEVIKEITLDYETNVTKFKIDEDVDFNNRYQVEASFPNLSEPKRKTIRFFELFKSDKFSKQYNYDGPLGVSLTEKTTTFRVWSPVSSKISVRIYKNGTPKFVDANLGSVEIANEKEMVKDKNGVFSITFPFNFHGYYYTYVVTNSLYNEKEIVDPYAKSCGINGMRGMIVDFSKTNPEGFENIKPHNIPHTKLVVYETHIADLTSSSTWTNDIDKRKLEKTFLGACLEGTTYSNNGRTVKTGFDHIKELGVNAVQLLPIFDQANNERKTSFNWGYNPLNYNALEGSYSTNPYDGLVRIKEFKTLVQKYNEAGINIIMDVVYNHVNGAMASNFDVLVPGYYFRHYDNTMFSNGSGCGNETASEMYMYRKFMIDSLLFWASEYKLGGFRFDLMGLHDLDTMNEIAAKLHELDKNIVIYGEPWCGGDSALNYEIAANKGNIYCFQGYGAFNDGMRDSLVKAGQTVFNSGWVSNTITESNSQQNCIANSIRGTYNPNDKNVSNPLTMVNYVSCHDNYTLFDRIKSLGIKDENEIKKMAMLSNAIVLTSNGISFILSGEEFLRTKHGVENSYNAAYKINELDYSLKLQNLDMFKNYQKLIELKKNVSDLCLEQPDNLNLNIDIFSPSLISYSLFDKDRKITYQVFHTNGYRNGKPILVDLDGYKLYLDTINPRKDLSNKTQLVPFETLIAYKENK